VYGREIEGSVTTFGTTGYTYNRVFALYDRATGSVWYPLEDGAFDAIGGPKRGAKIPFIEKPQIMRLGEWRQRHPDTDVLLEDNPPDPARISKTGDAVDSERKTPAPPRP
jgi:hypothetical protein